MLICDGLEVVYGQICVTNRHTIYDYKEPTEEILNNLKTTEIIPNFSTISKCNSNETCTMYCAMMCRRHNCTVYARQGNKCMVHNYNHSGGWNMKAVNHVLVKNGVNIGKPHISILKASLQCLINPTFCLLFMFIATFSTSSFHLLCKFIPTY